MQPGTLFVCATPIGNLGDCSFRLIETLQNVSLIAAEDTRHSKILLSHYQVKTPLISLQKYNESKRTQLLLAHLKDGKDVALISDAGTPNICDPGAYVIQAMHQNNIPVRVIPGPSSITALISVSGMLANQFTFLGFMPKKESEKKALFEKAGNDFPICFFETSKRLSETLAWLDENLNISHCVAAKELSKQFETIYTGQISDILDQLKAGSIKGEWCVLITLADPIAPSFLEVISSFKEIGLTKRQMLYLGKTYFGFSRNQLYSFLEEEKSEN